MLTEVVMARGRSIRIYLPSGEVTGLRHAELTNWTGQAIACPRARLDELSGWDEVQRPGVYFLIGADTLGQRQVYVGEAENVLTRLGSHLRQKDFWQEAVVFSSKDANLTKAHVKYLEHRLIDRLVEVGRAKVENGTGSRPPALPRADADAMEEYVDNVQILLGALGHRFLVPLASASPDAPADRFSYAIRGARAHGLVTDEGFVVLAGSTALPDAKEAMGVGNRELKSELLASGRLVEDGALLRFTDDVLFGTPSQAAVVVYGNAANGRVAWKLADGRTLKMVEEGGAS